MLLSEQLVRKSSSSPGELDLGPAIDIVCFAFQHAPRGKMTTAETTCHLVYRCF